jgi:hypothetical protein
MPSSNPILMPQSTSAISKECRGALAQAFARVNEDIDLDSQGYMTDPRHNLVEGVRFEDIEGDLLQGDGSELRGGRNGRPTKFLAAHSSTALAVNVFGLFRQGASALRMPWGGAITSLQFERKCSHGVGHGRPPNLDVILDGPAGVIGIESKCLEIIGDPRADFRPAYNEDLRGARRQTPWFHEMQGLMTNPRAYRRLDAAQLIKHALGLAFSFPGRRTTLAYIFWEPTNASEISIFREHRADLDRFKEAIGAGTPDFVSLSHQELWNYWATMDDAPVWLIAHVGKLRDRYSFAVDCGAQIRS